MNTYTKIRILYLQTPSHQTSLDKLTHNIEVFSSGMAISSVSHLRNYDFMVLDMQHVESMEVLEKIKHFLPERYVIACSSKPETVMQSLQAGADAVLLNPLDEKECKRVLYRAASYLNMQEIFYDTYYIDPLSACRNLNALKDRLKDNSRHNALLKLSLHNFKAFQIYYGAQITEKVLFEFKDAIKINLPVNAELFHTNEDEFSILLINPAPSQIKILSQQLKSFFEQTPIEVSGFLLKINTAIGIASGENLIQKADIALCEAKEGKRIASYMEGSLFIKEQKEHIKWVKIIQEAICEDRVIVHYQPIMENLSGAITKYEVLCRIEERDKSLYQPNGFIPAAIFAGRMCDITRLVIDKSFKYFQDKSHSFSINVTREDFMAEYLVDFISYKCDQYAIAPERLYIEVLENISTESAKGCLPQIEALRSLGCKISIDDFGVDSSNFSRMMQIHAQMLKIDGHFIQELLYDNKAKIIIENIVDFSRKIGAKTVAEYVDSQEIFDLVKSMGVDYSQGFYIGEPSAQI